MTKQHTNYSSAFAINEMAVLSFDSFGSDKLYGVVSGVMFYGPQRMYRVSIFANDGPESAPTAFLHEGRPIDGFIADDLLPVTDQYIPHIGHVGRYESTDHKTFGDSPFTSGQLVEIKIKDIADSFNVPVLITGVTYVEGKIMYDVSIERAYYSDGRVNGGRLVRDTLTGIDGIFIKPVGGWPEEGDDISEYALEIGVEDSAVPISNDIFDAAYDAHLLGVQCGELNKHAARNFLGAYINAENARVEKYLGARTGRWDTSKLNESSKPRSVSDIDTSKISQVQPWPKDE
ncbi:hypothetical protein MPK74_gp057 [Erwinia phage pEa_SNUABM_7]|uniref:Uncharacterized protein n=1 Tax=Erwinia phage pEa_SNUABM_7 TaxID=2866695 RepID=A0AAE7WSC6_9CAUD|nr:hypothetical protein MPK74_gp057 [Erwinia phage pEa_SNUABM_7]QYW04725.1 hypothetical protein pEaSNUABM7_00057 [Erwinia phage pEa_SNUABM_7]